MVEPHRCQAKSRDAATLYVKDVQGEHLITRIMPINNLLSILQTSLLCGPPSAVCLRHLALSGLHSATQCRRGHWRWPPRPGWPAWQLEGAGSRRAVVTACDNDQKWAADSTAGTDDSTATTAAAMCTHACPVRAAPAQAGRLPPPQRLPSPIASDLLPAANESPTFTSCGRQLHGQLMGHDCVA